MPTLPRILSGGSGTRLWPLSRSGYPKQFLALTSEYSLIQETLLKGSNSTPLITERLMESTNMVFELTKHA